jgi:hypothetical protein
MVDSRAGTDASTEEELVHHINAWPGGHVHEQGSRFTSERETGVTGSIAAQFLGRQSRAILQSLLLNWRIKMQVGQPRTGILHVVARKFDTTSNLVI